MTNAPTRGAGGDPTARLRDELASARCILIFTGAGISTESGIPDFRSPGGVWDRNQPILFDDFLRSEEMRRESWRRKRETDRSIGQAGPNRGHRAIADLVRRNPASMVVTQNVDGLHQASGVPEGQLVELHGNATYAACCDCGLRHELNDIFRAFDRDETLPTCRGCGSPYVKSATISFGQPMPVEAMRRAEAAARACDLAIAVGSSLVVYPAADVPLMAKQHGARYAILNREPTPQDGYADLVVHGEIGPVLGDAVDID